MKTKITGILLGLAIVAVVSFLSLRWHQAMEAGLPPIERKATKQTAFAAAQAWQTQHGGDIISVSGTGSMAPYIPAAPAGVDPYATVVAYVVTVPNATYADMRVGCLALYKPVWAKGGNVMHSTGAKDGAGYIMSGLANKRSEPQWRVTEANFVGIAAAVFTWPQEAN